VLLVSSNTLHPVCITRCTFALCERFHLTRGRARDCLFFIVNKNIPRELTRGEDDTTERVHIAPGIILCKSYYSRLTALQPTVMYSRGGFMRLCRIIPDLTHYYGELGATIRDSVRGMSAQSVVLSVQAMHDLKLVDETMRLLLHR